MFRMRGETLAQSWEEPLDPWVLLTPSHSGGGDASPMVTGAPQGGTLPSHLQSM